MENHQRLPKKVLGPRAELARLIEELEKGPGDYEPIAPSDWPPLQVLLPVGRESRRAVYLTKDSVLSRWMAEDLLPRDWVVLCRSGLPTDEYMREVRGRLAKARPAIFVGDLDPLDLHVYLALRYGKTLLGGRPLVSLKYGGINDACLRLCDRNIKYGRRLDEIMFRMRPSEIRHFAILDSMVDIAAIVGKRSHELLRAGWKLELEGMTNAVFFRDGHLRSTVHAVAGSGRQKAPALPTLT